MGVRMGAELSQGPLPGKGRKSGAFRRLHLLGSLMRTWGLVLLGRPGPGFSDSRHTLSLFPSRLLGSLSFSGRVFVCPSISMCPCVSLTLSTFPCFLTYVLSSFPVQVSFQAHIRILCCVMVMQSRGHGEKTPEEDPGEVSVSERAGGEAGPQWPWSHSLTPAFPVPCLLSSKGRVGQTAVGKAPSRACSTHVRVSSISTEAGSIQ